MRPSTTPMGLRPRPEERVDARTPSVWTRIELQRSRLQTQQAKGLLDFRDAAEQPHLFPGAAARGTLLLPKPGAAPRRASAAAPLNVHHPRAHHATQAHHALKPQRVPPISAASMFETLATRYAGRAGGAPQVRSLPAAVAAARAAEAHHSGLLAAQRALYERAALDDPGYDPDEARAAYAAELGRLLDGFLRPDARARPG